MALSGSTMHIGLHEFRVLLDGGFQGFHDLFHSLMKFGLVRIGLLHFGDYIFND